MYNGVTAGRHRVLPAAVLRCDSTRYSTTSPATTLFCIGDVSGLEQFWQRHRVRIDCCAATRTRPLLPPAEIFCRRRRFCEPASSRSADRSRAEAPRNNAVSRSAATALPPVAVDRSAKDPLVVAQHFARRLRAARADRRRIGRPREETMQQYFAGIRLSSLSPWTTGKDSSQRTRVFAITVASLATGFACPPKPGPWSPKPNSMRRTVRRKEARAPRRAIRRSASSAISPSSLGAPIVHVQHGVGRYRA